MKEEIKKCPYCNQPNVKERSIIQNNLAWAFPTNIPIVPGHVLIAPNRCVTKFSELTKEEVAAIFELLDVISKSLKKSFGAEGFNFAWNEGNLAGQSIGHFHLHVLPRKKNDGGVDEYEPRKFLYRPGSRETSPQDELLAVAELIKKNL